MICSFSGWEPSIVPTCSSTEWPVLTIAIHFQSKFLPGLYNWANSWAPLCCGPHRGWFSSVDWIFFETSQFAFGSSSGIEFSRICSSVLTGVCAKEKCWKCLMDTPLRHWSNQNSYGCQKWWSQVECCWRYCVEVICFQRQIFARVGVCGVCFQRYDIHRLSHLGKLFYFISSPTLPLRRLLLFCG